MARDEVEAGEPVGVIHLRISPEVRAYLIAANEAGKRQAEEEATEDEQEHRCMMCGGVWMAEYDVSDEIRCPAPECGYVMRAHLMQRHVEAMNKDRQAEEEAAEAAAVKPFTVAEITRYFREWMDLRAIIKIDSDESYTYFNARHLRDGHEHRQLRVDRAGYIVDGSYFSDIWKRKATDDEWEQVDSIGKDLSEESE